MKERYLVIQRSDRGGMCYCLVNAFEHSLMTEVARVLGV